MIAATAMTLCTGTLIAGNVQAEKKGKPAIEYISEEERPAGVYFKDGKLNFATKDKKFRVWLDNRIYIDGAYYIPDTDISTNPT